MKSDCEAITSVTTLVIRLEDDWSIGAADSATPKRSLRLALRRLESRLGKLYRFVTRMSNLFHLAHLRSPFNSPLHTISPLLRNGVLWAPRRIHSPSPLLLLHHAMGSLSHISARKPWTSLATDSILRVEIDHIRPIAWTPPGVESTKGWVR